MEMILAAAAGYLLGSISFGIIVTRLFKGIDIRDYGSGSTGMTNVLRTAGKGPAALVLMGDVLKGVISTYIGLTLGGVSYGVLAGLAAMAGHAYPLYFGFKGGKSVATGFGIILTLAPDATLIAASVFLLTTLISRYVSLGSILAAVSAPILMYLFAKPLPVFVFALVGATFVIYAHRANIKRLYQGKEYKFGKK